MNWTKVSDPHCNYRVAEISLGDGVVAAFQHWPDDGKINVRIEPTEFFWNEYDARAATIGWTRIEPWFVALRKKQTAALDRFYNVIKAELKETVSLRDRLFMDKTQGEGVLHFKAPQ
ncbi:MAG: hypothetical protein AB7P23_05685 [Amphiplicatus sp.]